MEGGREGGEGGKEGAVRWVEAREKNEGRVYTLPLTSLALWRLWYNVHSYTARNTLQLHLVHTAHAHT